MPEVIDLDAILENQPQLDPDEVKASRELSERLENTTGHRRYELVQPYSGRQVRPVDLFTQNPESLPDR